MKYLPVALALALAGAAQAQSFFDDFNRPDEGTLGANWTNVAATTQVVNNQATNGQTTYGLSTVNGLHASYTSVTLSMDITATAGLVNYGALVFGYAGPDFDRAIFVKVQDNDMDGLFDHYAFYTGNAIPSGPLNIFTDLTSQFASARMTVWAANDNVVDLGIDTNADGLYEQEYMATGASGLSLGDGVGIGLYGNTLADNFSVGPVPEPLSCAVLGLGVLGLLGLRRKA